MKILLLISAIVEEQVCLVMSIKRFHDFDKSGYFLLAYSVIASIIIIAISVIFFFVLNNETLVIGFAGIAALAFVLYIYLKPGTAGVNKYGNQPAALFDLGLDNNIENKNINPVISDNSNNQ